MSPSRPHRPDTINLRRERHGDGVGVTLSPEDRAGVDAESEGGSFVGRALVLERATRERSAADAAPEPR
jgi:hypothetical protein